MLSGGLIIVGAKFNEGQYQEMDRPVMLSLLRIADDAAISRLATIAAETSV